MAKKKRVTEMEWEVVDGTIRTVEKVKKMKEFLEEGMEVHVTIAHNVGSDLAHYIVGLHHHVLKSRGILK
jgi:hypothetical protein